MHKQTIFCLGTSCVSEVETKTLKIEIKNSGSDHSERASGRRSEEALQKVEKLKQQTTIFG